VLTPLIELSRELPLVFPVHPRTRPRLEAARKAAGEDRLIVIEPLGYLDFLRLTTDARIVLTDSGGIQEETTILGVPCVTLRNNTERPVTLTHGTNRLAGTTADSIRRAIAEALAAPPVDRDPPPLWDGQASRRIAEIVVSWSAAR
jgi:UDP-N-acetylglucosamine 2-epimerase (non-hydrolysing)